MAVPLHRVRFSWAPSTHIDIDQDSRGQETGTRMAARLDKEDPAGHWLGPNAGAVRLADRNAAGAKPQRGSWEVRSALPSQRIARLILCFHEQTLIVLHGFIKKTQKTPPDDLGLAKRRMREVTT